jgi:hypothetical protein
MPALQADANDGHHDEQTQHPEYDSHAIISY